MKPSKIAKIALTAFRVFLVAACAMPTQAEESGALKDRADLPQPVERASADDCAILIEVGKHEMNWGTTAPDFAFYSEFDRVGGGTYLEDCPWRALGVAEPLTKAQQPEKAFFITRPAYSGTDATVDLEYSISGRIVDGKRMPPFLMAKKCTLQKSDDQWHLVGCQMKSRT